MAITYRYGSDFSLDEAIELYRASTLGERRPIDDREAMAEMMRHANLTVTAWDGAAMVGISRSLTDFSYVAYLSDLAVHADYQRRGIGVELIRLTREKLGPKAKIVLLAAPAAEGYYPRIGFRNHASAWLLDPGAPFPRE
jgi:predicted N-acetyltransferase YhbS